MEYNKIGKSKKNSNNIIKNGSLTNRNYYPNPIIKLNNQEINNNISQNSTGFSFDFKRKNLSRRNSSKDYSNLFYLPKKNDNEKIEEKKIKDIFFKLSTWDNEILEKKKFQGLEIIENYNKETKKQIDLIKRKEEVDDFIKKKLFKLPKVEKHIRNKSQNVNEGKLFDFNVFLEGEEKEEKNKGSLIGDSSSFDILRDQKRTEIKHRKALMDIYENILLNKLKKRRYESILDETYHLLDSARTEYLLCIDILRERIKSVEKYYEAFINSYNNKNKNNNDKHNKNKHNIDSNKNDNIEMNDNESNIENKIYNSNDSEYENENNTNKDNKEIKYSETNILSAEDNLSIKSQSSESKKKNKKKTNLEILEEKIKKYNEYISIKEDILSEIKGYDKRFSEINEQLSIIIKNSKEKVKKCNEEGINYRYLFQELSNEQKKYYLDILKKGKDTRNEGLTWVIKRLIELKVHLDESMFPSFLDNEQIEYLINISKLGFEKNQLKLIVNTLKHRHKMNRSNSLININNFNEKRNENKISNYIKTIFKPGIISKKLIHQMEKLYLKHEDSTKNLIEKKVEESEIKNIVLKNKKFIHQIAINKINLDEEKEDNYLHCFMEQEKQKRYFYDIIQLNERIKELDSFINKLIQEEINVFEDKIKFAKKANGENLDNFRDKVYNALFGIKQ